jgi:hypothetical protein
MDLIIEEKDIREMAQTILEVSNFDRIYNWFVRKYRMSWSKYHYNYSLFSIAYGFTEICRRRNLVFPDREKLKRYLDRQIFNFLYDELKIEIPKIPIGSYYNEEERSSKKYKKIRSFSNNFFKEVDSLISMLEKYKEGKKKSISSKKLERIAEIIASSYLKIKRKERGWSQMKITKSEFNWLSHKGFSNPNDLEKLGLTKNFEKRIKEWINSSEYLKYTEDDDCFGTSYDPEKSDCLVCFISEECKKAFDCGFFLDSKKKQIVEEVKEAIEKKKIEKKKIEKKKTEKVEEKEKVGKEKRCIEFFKDDFEKSLKEKFGVGVYKTVLLFRFKDKNYQICRAQDGYWIVTRKNEELEKKIKNLGIKIEEIKDNRRAKFSKEKLVELLENL